MTCVICLEEMTDPECRIPDCGHSFHCSCLINFTRYDLRCPVCRRVPSGVSLPQTSSHVEEGGNQEGSLEESNLEETRRLLEDFQSTWRRYSYQRRRFMRTHPEIQKAFDKLKEVRSKMASTTNEVDREYNRICREVWRSDPFIVQKKREMSNMRRRERRLELLLQRGFEREFGPEPEMVLVTRQVSIHRYL